MQCNTKIKELLMSISIYQTYAFVIAISLLFAAELQGPSTVYDHVL